MAYMVGESSGVPSWLSRLSSEKESVQFDALVKNEFEVKSKLIWPQYVKWFLIGCGFVFVLAIASNIEPGLEIFLFGGIITLVIAVMSQKLMSVLKKIHTELEKLNSETST